jgi:hypothetical protein
MRKMVLYAFYNNLRYKILMYFVFQCIKYFNYALNLP